MRSIIDFIPAGYELKQVTAGELAGPCPWCGGRDRFHVWPGKGKGGRFWCRGCGRQGDGIQFLRERDGLSYVDACRAIGATPATPARSGRPVSRLRAVPSRPSLDARHEDMPDATWCRAAGLFLGHAVETMARDTNGQAYAASRGILPATVTALGLGWVQSDLWWPRATFGLPEETNPETGRPRKVWLPAGLVIPSFDETGRVWALKIRRSAWTPEDRNPKYWGVKGSGKAPFVLLPGRGKPCVVVESELDAILCAQEAGSIVCAIAIRTARGKPDDATLAMVKAAPVILIALDRDTAGREGTPWWLENFTNARRWMVPSGNKDVGDLAKRPGLIRAWVQAGLRATR